MHESGLCAAVVEAVERRAGGRTVSGVRVQVGVDHRVDHAAFAQAFAVLAQSGPAAGAEVEVVDVAGAEIVLESIRIQPDA